MRENNFITKILPNVSTILIVAAMLIVNRVLAEPSGLPAIQTGGMDQLSYQGTLLDSEGNPVDGYQDITFRIYNHPTDLTFLWEEAHTGANAVPVSSGLFNVLLGSLNPIPDTIWNEKDIYLGVQVASDTEFAPRELINLLPPRIAINSLNANVLKNGSISFEKLGEDITIPVIQSGQTSYFISSPGWNLDEGYGTRDYIDHITFNEPFTDIPNVVLSLKRIDIDKDFNSRLDVLALNVTKTGFDLVIRAWSNTVVYSAGVTWIAIQD